MRPVEGSASQRGAGGEASEGPILSDSVKSPVNPDDPRCLPTTKAPEPPKPKPCEPDPCCKCPPPPTATSNCLEELITSQTTEITKVEKAKAFKTDLEALLAKAKAAELEYTRKKYDDLVKQWAEQDRQIAELIRKLVCAVPCWRCLLECHVCPLINQMIDAEKWLYGDGTLYTDVHNLYDLRYWHERDRDAKQRRFDRIKNVLQAWEKPAQTIQKALSDDSKLITDAGNALGSDAPKAVYDVFMRLVPMHLAIAPPTGSKLTTQIDEKFTLFCKCDEGVADDCCGPDVGVLSVRKRLIGPQPYLIDPNYYFSVICCLVEKRYLPAKDALATADAAFQAVDDRIKRYRADIGDGLKTFNERAKDAIPKNVDCCDYEAHKDDSVSAKAR